MSESVKLNDEKRIIVVDDDADILEFLQYELHTYDEGFTINTFENGFSALDFVMQINAILSLRILQCQI